MDKVSRDLVKRDLLLARVRSEQEDQIRELDKTTKMLVRRDLDLLQANDAMRELDQAKNQFVSLVAHQLRTPLSTIKWYVELLLSHDIGNLNINQEKYMTQIYQSNQRMINLINDILNASRIELGTFAAEPQPTDFSQVADSVIDEVLPLAKTRKVDIKKEYKDVPTIVADPKFVRVIFQNLLANAVQYTLDDGKGEVDLKLIGDGKNLNITVSDNGYGIPEVAKAKIFSKLFRADNVAEKDTTGTGLGLSIVRELVLMHNGDIWFESELGKGTTFYIGLPVKQPKGSQQTQEDLSRGQ